jgi:two-component system nitrate/nitrite response regulator NarL
MNAVPVPPAISLQLRVAVSAINPATARRLADRIAESGHTPVPVSEPADVVLSDGSASADIIPVIALGLADGDFAGVLPDDVGLVQLDAALRAVAAGLIVRFPAASRPGFAALPEEPAAALTPREIEVLTALAEGLGNKAVARRLGISPHTVKFHIESVFRKLGAGTRAEAVAKGLRRQIVEF